MKAELFFELLNIYVMYKGLFPLPSLARIDTGKYTMCYGTLFLIFWLNICLGDLVKKNPIKITNVFNW